MATKTDQRPLMEQDAQDLPSPPAYQPVGKSSSASQGFIVTSPPTAKLPTYDQSEKFTKGNVVLVTALPVEEDGEEEPARHGGSSLYRSGTLFEFVLFFFSFFGIVLAFCFATSIAAQSGAIAGLGATFIIQPFVYEFYYKTYELDLSTNWCNSYRSNNNSLPSCMHRTTIGIRLLLVIFGLIGLVLLYKGFSGYFRSIRSSNTNN